MLKCRIRKRSIFKGGGGGRERGEKEREGKRKGKGKGKKRKWKGEITNKDYCDDYTVRTLEMEDVGQK